MRGALWLALVGSVAVACGALGSSSESDVAPTSAGVGPFRELLAAEDLGKAPFVLDGAGSPYREPSALPQSASDSSSMGVLLYAVAPAATGTASVIVRTSASDARSFYGTSSDIGTVPEVVLSASLPWEGTSVTGPSALRVGSEIQLYYAAAGGIGLAHSSDGLHFDKEPDPVLAPDPTVHWETTAPFAPSVAVLPDGTFDMMYAAGVAIGEATSSDGVHFTRVDADPTTPATDPVLSPLEPASTLTSVDGGSLPFDLAQVSDPCVLPVTSPAGRLVVRVLYTGYDGAPGATTRTSAIGFAARFGTSGPLVRQREPAFSISKQEAAPTLFTWSGGAILYVHANAGGSFLTPAYPAIAAGVAPTEITLAAPVTYATSP